MSTNNFAFKGRQTAQSRSEVVILRTMTAYICPETRPFVSYVSSPNDEYSKKIVPNIISCLPSERAGRNLIPVHLLHFCCH